MRPKGKDTGAESLSAREKLRLLWQRVCRAALVEGSGMRFQLLLFNMRPLVIIELLYSAFSTAVFLPLLWRLADTFLGLAGFEYLSVSNAFSFFLNPLGLGSAVVLVLGLAIYSLIDISAAIYIFECSRQRVKTSFLAALRFSLRNAVRLLHLRNMPIVVVVLALMPLVSIGVSSSCVSSFTLSFSMKGFIVSHPLVFAVALALFGMLLFLACRWLFAVHYYTLEKVDYISATKKSARLARGKRIQNLISMLLVQVVIALANAMVVFLCTRAATFAMNLFGGASVAGSTALGIVVVAYVFCISIVNALGMPLSCLRISALFYNLKEASGEAIAPLDVHQRKTLVRGRDAAYMAVALTVFLSVLACAMFFNVVANGAYDPQYAQAGTTKTYACRGDFGDVPENTMAFLDSAIEQGADGCEFDVQMSKDGQLFLHHDTDFLRTCADPTKVWDYTYLQISRLSFQLYYDVRQTGACIPLLEDVLEAAKEADMPLILDISGLSEYSEEDRSRALRALSAVLEETGCSALCEVSSSSYDDLQELRRIDEGISEVCVLDYVMGNPASAYDVDAFAVDQSSVSEVLVSNVHESGKELYVWGADSSTLMERAVLYGSDIIVTSQVEKALELAERGEMPEFVYKIIKNLKE